MRERSKVAMSKENDKNPSLIGHLPADTVSKVLARHDKGSNRNDTSNSMCEGTAFEETSMVGSKLEFSREQVGAGLNDHMASSVASS